MIRPKPLITFYIENEGTSEMIQELMESARSAVVDHRLNHCRTKRCHPYCILRAIEEALKDNTYAQLQFQCQVCDIIFDDFASAYYHRADQ